MANREDSQGGPYGSARDLPKVREMELILKGSKFLTMFLARHERPNLEAVEQEMNELIDLVDRFYEVLGEKHWIFHGSLPTSQVADALAAATVDEVEERFIAIYRDPDYFRWRLMPLKKHEGIRSRMHQLERAIKHYQADEFDSCSLQLIAVMDGFVNDVDADMRRGLHARDEGEMVAWDSVVGHHLGLTNVMSVFKKTIKKRVDEEIFEVHRNGIVHGTTPRFDNVVVATKAWNLFFSVVDWVEASEKAAEPAEPQPTIRETLSKLADNERIKQEIAEFQRSTLVASDQGFDEDEMVRLTICFFDTWKRKNWGSLRDFVAFRDRKNSTFGALAGELKELFGAFTLEDFEMCDVVHQAPALRLVHGTATVNGQRGSFECRWTFENEDGKVMLPSEGGSPKLFFCSPSIFKRDPYTPPTPGG